MNKIKHLFYYIFKAKIGGLLEDIPDERDFDLGLFGFSKYKPKHIRTNNAKNIKYIKNQRSLNNCVFNATTVQKENDEKIELSVRSLTLIANYLKYITGNGYSTLRKGQKALYKHGIEPEKDMPTTKQTWKGYINTLPNYTNASKHKIASYWAISKKEDIFKMLDEGKYITTGLKWFSSYNMGGGFRFPYIVDQKITDKGYNVGSHAVLIVDYDLDYDGREVLKIQNSYGANWGDNGYFYIDLEYFMKINLGMYVNLDIKKDVGKFLHEYDGKNVKGRDKSSIYHIQKGKKKPYLDWLAFLSFNGFNRGFEVIDQEIIDEVEKGDFMDITKSNYWEFLKRVKSDKQIDKLLEILNNNEL